MNSRGKKSRSSSVRGGRSKGHERQFLAENVYSNHRFMQSAVALVGLPVQVVTNTKEVFEGILNTFSSNFDLVLDFPHTVNNTETSVISNPDTIKPKMIFRPQDIVIIKATNVDLDYASKGIEPFAVDGQISKYNNGRAEERELEPFWQGGETPSNAELALEDSANGWDADDMFKKNEEKYGVQSTYNPTLEGYTTLLQKKNTKEYKEQEAKAQKIALEIEHSPVMQTRSQFENGEDEEERYSAVIRPDLGASGGTSSDKYMPPQRRKIQQGNNNKQPSAVRGTPSPQSSAGTGTGLMGGSRYGVHNSYPPHQAGPTTASTASLPPSSLPYSSQTKHSPTQHLPKSSPQPQAPPVDANKINDNRDYRKHDSFSRDNNFEDINHSSHQSHHQSYYHEPREQREPRKLRNQKDEQIAELKKFGQDFTLTDKKVAVQQPGQCQPQPEQGPSHTVKPQQQSPNQQGQITQQSNTSCSSSTVPISKPVTSKSQVQSQQLAVHVPSVSQPGPSSERQELSGGNTITSAASVRSPVSSQDDDKTALAVSNSKLNPNAKEFVFNPNAKPFSPRSPSTTTPPRPQTPQMPLSHPPSVAAGGIPSLSFSQNMVHTYVMAQPFSMQPQPRYSKRVNVGSQRPDYASSVQVAAATGQPLLAPTITAPQGIPTVQIPQNMMTQAAQPYSYHGIPMMVRMSSPGIPMMTTMVPTSIGMYHHGEAHQNSHGHNTQHVYVGQSAAAVTHQPHPSAANPIPHPGQPPTPQGHNNAGGPNHQMTGVPNQPPTPGPTPPQQVMYSSGPGGAPMGAQPTIPQHMPPHSPHTAPSPHNQYMGNHALAAAPHHGHPTQLVMLPPHMAHMLPPGGPPHSGTGHAQSTMAAGYSTVSGAIQHMNPGHQVHYIPAGAPGGQAHLPIVHPNQ